MNQHVALAPLSDEDRELSLNYPAAESRGKFYLIQNDAVIGKMRMVSGIGMGNGTYVQVSVEPDDDVTREFFKDDYTVPLFNSVVGLFYDGITGRPVPHFKDEPEDRHKGTEIVDRLNFDLGIAHPRLASVKGWGAGRTGESTSSSEDSREPSSSF
jgi:hypothetical protein